MVAHSKEFYELRDAFEKTVKCKNTDFYLSDLSRSPKNEKNSFYENGNTDKFFQMFMQGYEYAKLIQRLDS